MIIENGVECRSYEEQVIKNMEDIEELKQSGGAVSSVNEKTGEVVLDATDIKLTTNTQTIQANIIRIDETLDSKLDANKSALSNIGGLVVPTSAPTDTILVGLATDREQLNIYLGDGLQIQNNILSVSFDEAESEGF